MKVALSKHLNAFLSPLKYTLVQVASRTIRSQKSFRLRVVSFLLHLRFDESSKMALYVRIRVHVYINSNGI